MSFRAAAQRRHVTVAALVMGGLAGRPSTLSAQTIRRADIERAGWNRVTEILEGATGWARASVDGFTYSLSPDHLPAAGESAPGMPDLLVFIDGQRVRTELFGMHLLELLPISIGQIDSVTFTRGPVIIAGRPSARGVMRIFSRHLHQGLNADLTYQHGDESGDPGPYRYTSLSSSNVEKLGPFAHGDVGWAGGAWELDAGLHVASLNITDTLISSRFPTGTFGQLRPDVVSVTPTARVTLTALGGRHTILASYADQRGLLFVPTFGREQSLRITSSHVGIDGMVAARGTGLRYEASSSTLDVSELRSPLAFTVGHSRRNAAGSIEVSRRIDEGTLTIGALGEWWTLAFEGRSGTRSIGGGGPFVSWLQPIGRATSVGATSTLVFDGRQAGSVDATVESSVRLDSLTSIDLRASRTHAHPSMDGTWIDGAVLSYEVPAGTTTFDAFDVGLTRRLGSDVAMIVGARGERVTGWRGLQQHRQGRTPPLDSVAHNANFITARLRAETVGRGIWQGAIEYDHTAAFRLDDEMFRAQIRSTPRNDLRAQVSASPVADFRLSGILSLTDGSRWQAFADSIGVVPAVSPVRRVDASLEKWLWHRRLRVELVYRNILNEVERYHPLGAQWNLRWHLSGSLVL